jgi:5'-deoxynucleotidase YfbR-like HD superfamily hydrolase
LTTNRQVLHKVQMSKRTASPRAWQRMLSGRRLDLLDPTPVDIEIEDIAHGLAFVARWNGQTHGEFPYSVAEHSLLVEELFGRIDPAAPAKWRLAALLHDAPEYVIGDMISPVKAAVGPGYSDLDDRLTAAVHLRFGLPATIPQTIKRRIKKADKISAWLEATQIAGFASPEADKFFGKPDSSLIQGLSIVIRPPIDARQAFVARHTALLASL